MSIRSFVLVYDTLAARHHSTEPEPIFARHCVQWLQHFVADANVHVKAREVSPVHSCLDRIPASGASSRSSLASPTRNSKKSPKGVAAASGSMARTSSRRSFGSLDKRVPSWWVLIRAEVCGGEAIRCCFAIASVRASAVSAGQRCRGRLVAIVPETFRAFTSFLK
jgi:hypothetical protein